MTLSSDLHNSNHSLWEKMVTHPFVLELGDGKLSQERFRRYLLQDYVFLRTLAKVVGVAVARAPSLEAAQPMAPFLTTILNAENDLFARAFQEMGVPLQEYHGAQPLPTTLAMGNFMLATAYDGTFDDIATIFMVTEGAYHDWATRLAAAGKRPSQRMYQEWIDIHAAQELGDFVAALRRHVDSLPATAMPRLQAVFRTTLRYEYLFWEMAYNGESWPK